MLSWCVNSSSELYASYFAEIYPPMGDIETGSQKVLCRPNDDTIVVAMTTNYSFPFPRPSFSSSSSTSIPSPSFSSGGSTYCSESVEQTTTPNDVADVDDDVYLRLEKFLLNNVIVIICAFGLVGNVLNLIVLTSTLLFKKPMDRMERSATIGLLALAMSDLLFCVAIIPYSVYDFVRTRFEDGLSFMLFFHVYNGAVISTMVTTSTLLTVVMAVSRYLAICRPLQARVIIGIRFATASTVTAFIFSILLNLPKFWYSTYVCLIIPPPPSDLTPLSSPVSPPLSSSYYYYYIPGIKPEMTNLESISPDSTEETPTKTVYVSTAGYLARHPDLERAYYIAYLIVGILGPLVVLAYCNFFLIRALRKSSRMRGQFVARTAAAGAVTSSHSSPSPCHDLTRQRASYCASPRHDDVDRSRGSQSCGGSPHLDVKHFLGFDSLSTCRYQDVARSGDVKHSCGSSSSYSASPRPYTKHQGVVSSSSCAGCHGAKRPRTNSCSATPVSIVVVLSPVDDNGILRTDQRLLTTLTRPFSKNSPPPKSAAGVAPPPPSPAAKHSAKVDATNTITLTLTIIVVMYTVLVLPAEICNIFTSMVDSKNQPAFSFAVTVANTLQTVNFSFNFVLYFVINVQFRLIIHDIITCRIWRRGRRGKNSQHASSSGGATTGTVVTGSMMNISVCSSGSTGGGTAVAGRGGGGVGPPGGARVSIASSSQCVAIGRSAVE